MPVHDIAEGARFLDQGADATLVWFAGIQEPFLKSDFLAGVPMNALFLRDVNNDWYTGGVSGLSMDEEGTARWLRPFLAEHGPYSVFGGQSSGGYAALRMAHGLSPNLCIAFAPQTGNRPGFNGHIQPGVPITLLDELYERDPKNFPIKIHVSRSENSHSDQFFWDDWSHVGPMQKFPNVTVCTHPNDAHAISLYLYGKKMFYESIVIDSYLHAEPRFLNVKFD